MKPNEKENIFTDEVDYANTADASVWGTEDLATTNLINKTEIHGKWLNLCAGDGRFNNKFLEKADEVVAVDIDESALQKLVRITPDFLKNKLSIKTMNVTERFLLKNADFDGVFSVGTMHLFPKAVFKNIVSEIDRILKPGGRIIIDFATDIKRTYSDGSLWIVENEPNYSTEEALVFLEEVFQNYKTNFTVETVEPELVKLKEKEYVFTSNFVLVTAIKQN